MYADLEPLSITKLRLFPFEVLEIDAASGQRGGLLLFYAALEFHNIGTYECESIHQKLRRKELAWRAGEIYNHSRALFIESRLERTWKLCLNAAGFALDLQRPFERCFDSK